MLHCMLKKMLLVAAVLVMVLCCAVSLAEGDTAAFTPLYPLRSDAPELTAEGFLPEDSQEEYYLVIDKEAGEWTYIDHEMFINIRQFKDVVERERNLIWYETEVKVAPGVKFMIQHANPDPQYIGRKFLYAHDFARQTNSILAISDDFYGFRVYAKRRPGVIIQNGVILADDTLSQPHWTLPTYDLIALYEDGSLKTYLAGEIGAEELLAQGVTDTWCFGPVLLSNGEIGQQVIDKQFEYINPRQTLGMIEPNHYLIMTVEGRHKNSDGVGLTWCAERMRDLGCTEALNLDGGNSIKLVFMGSLINSDQHYNEKNDRTVTSMITLGTFPLETILGEEE
ncbi:MAG: phosphodiester glycosidase family protein [Clostridia bacterium]|nr:phosphodiester glycosidase family protein [Clostridia bacterium]